MFSLLPINRTQQACATGLEFLRTIALKTLPTLDLATTVSTSGLVDTLRLVNLCMHKIHGGTSDGMGRGFETPQMVPDQDVRNSSSKNLIKHLKILEAPLWVPPIDIL